MGDVSPGGRQAAIAVVAVIQQAFDAGHPPDPHAVRTLVDSVGPEERTVFISALAGLAVAAAGALAEERSTTPREVLRGLALGLGDDGAPIARWSPAAPSSWDRSERAS